MISLINEIDQKMLFMIQTLHNPFLDRVMLVFTTLGNGGMIWLAISVLLIIKKKTRMIGIIAIFALILSAVIGDGILKPLFHRLRPLADLPELEMLIKEPTIYSFPSGHTASSFAAAFVISTYFKKYFIVFWLLAGMIAISRIYLYMHYPSDVIAGAILGILCAMIAIYLGNLKRDRNKLIKNKQINESEEGKC